VTLFSAARQRVTSRRIRDPADFCRKTTCDFGAEVYRNSTGVSVLGKSAGKKCRRKRLKFSDYGFFVSAWRLRLDKGLNLIARPQIGAEVFGPGVARESDDGLAACFTLQQLQSRRAQAIASSSVTWR
jgi:hypothetical protein